MRLWKVLDMGYRSKNQKKPVRKKPGMKPGKLGIAGILPSFPENWDFKAGITGN